MQTGPQAAGTPRTFSSEELLRISDEVARAGAGVPPRPAATEIVLLAIDPRRAHAYWNVEIPDLNRARRETGRSYAPMVVRVRLEAAASGAAPPVEEREVRLLQGSAYFEDLAPGSTYAVELGLRKPDGALALLASSEPVQLAPAEPSARQDTVAIDTRRRTGEAPVLTDLAAEVTGSSCAVPLPYLQGLHAASSADLHFGG